MNILDNIIADLIITENSTKIDNINILMLLKELFANKVVQNFYENNLSLLNISKCTPDDLLNFGMTMRGIDSAREKVKNADAVYLKVKKTAEYCNANKIEIITKWDKYFPKNLRKINDPPTYLFVKTINKKVLLEESNIAIVGTRSSTPLGSEITGKVAEYFSNEFNIISGLAKGIDTAAHKGCLQNNKKKTIAVVTDVQNITPIENRELADQIINSGGAIISENEPNIKTKPFHFIQRNRIQSGMSLGVFPIESDLESGTVHTVEFSKKQNKPIFCPDLDRVPNYPERNKEGKLIRELISKHECIKFTNKNYDQVISKLNKELINDNENISPKKISETLFNFNHFISSGYTKDKVYRISFRWYVPYRRWNEKLESTLFSKLIIKYKENNMSVIDYFASLIDNKLMNKVDGSIALIPIPPSQKTTKESIYSNKLLIKQLCKISTNSLIDLSNHIQRKYEVPKKTKEFNENKHKDSLSLVCNLNDYKTIVIFDDIITNGNTSKGIIELIKKNNRPDQKIYFFTFGKTISDYALPYFPKEISIPKNLLSA